MNIPAGKDVLRPALVVELKWNESGEAAYEKI